MAKGSWATYQRTVTAMTTFLQQFQIDTTLPISPIILAFFITHMYNQKYAPSTIETYVAAIGYVHKLCGKADPTVNFLVKKAIQGAKKERATLDVRLPITYPILTKLVEALPFCTNTRYQHLMFASMFLLAFAAFLRVGEIALSHGNERNVLNLKDVTINNDTGGIRIIFKNIKHSGGRQKVVEIAKQANKCPVKTLKEYLQLRGGEPGYLYRWPVGNPVTRADFNKVLHCVLHFCALDPALYKSHSFRIGAASYAASLGHSETQIREMGRWRSEAFKRYIRF